MRQIIAVVVGWLLFIPLLMIFSILISEITGFTTKYQGFSRNDIIIRFTQNPGEAISFGLGLLLASLITIFISSFVAGLIAKKNGFLVGSISSSFILIIVILGEINRGSYHFSLSGLFPIVLFLGVGAISGYLGTKSSEKFKSLIP